MAFDDVKKVRLGVADPVGFNDFACVADAGALPAENAPPQTAYSVRSLKVYKAYDETAGEWQTVPTELSDERIQFFVDAYGADKARWHCLKAILVSVGRKLGLAKLKSGADEMTFLKLQDLYAFYKNLLDDIMEAIDPPMAAGAWLRTGQPDIGGGM